MNPLIIHYSLHLLIPGAVAFLFYRKDWKRAWLILLTTMVVDIDHLLAVPIYDAARCSINFHPLHGSFAILFYIMLLIPKKSRLVAIGLVLHMATDWIDCLMM